MLKNMISGVFAVSLLFVFSAPSVYAKQSPFADALQKNKFPPAEQVFQFDYNQRDAELRVRFDIQEGFYLYQHRFAFTPEEKVYHLHPLPVGIEHSDAFFGDTVIYRDSLELVLDLNAALRNEVLQVHFQGCADDGFCYPPSTHQVFLRRTNGAQAMSTQTTSKPSVTPKPTNKATNWLVLGSLVLLFGAIITIRKKKKK